MSSEIIVDRSMPVPTGLNGGATQNSLYAIWDNQDAYPNCITEIQYIRRAFVPPGASYRPQEINWDFWNPMNTMQYEGFAYSHVAQAMGFVFEIRARYLYNDRESEWCESVRVYQSDDAPNNPSGFRSSKSGSSINLAWNNSTRDYKRTNIYRAVINNSQAARCVGHRGGAAGQGESFTDNPGKGTWYYWIKAHNSQGISGNFVGPQIQTIS